MRITIQMELKPTNDPLAQVLHVLNYNCMALEDNFIMW